MKTYLNIYTNIIHSVIIIGLFTTLQSCISKNLVLRNDEINEIIAKEIAFDSVKSDISKISYVLGIARYKKMKHTKPNEITFKVEGNKTMVNGENMNLDNTEIVFKKESPTRYSISTYLQSWGTKAYISVDGSSKKFTFKYNEKIISQNNLVELTNRQRIVIMILSNFYDELRISNPYFDHYSNLKSEYDAPIGRDYYGYIIGWGFTREQSIDDELETRKGAGSLIETYKCKLLGTSTSCFYESIGCVTISTFKCYTDH